MVLRSPKKMFLKKTFWQNHLQKHFRQLALGTAVTLVLTTCFSQKVLAQTPLRVMAANTTSGNRQSYDPGEGTRIFQGLAPDVVLIQEFNFGNNSDSIIREWVESTFGSDFEYYREDDAQIPNGVISRFPIVESGEWEDVHVGNRDFAWARIDIPGEADLWTVSVHFLTRNASVRDRQANALRRLVKDNIPEGDYLVIGGDFNTSNAGEPALDTLDELVDTDGPYPVDQDGKIGTNASRRKPYDWVFADADLEAYEVPVQIGMNSFPSGLVFDSRVYTPLEDVAPVQRGDSGATNMQHMAVIRDFVLPDSAEDAIASSSEEPVNEAPGNEAPDVTTDDSLATLLTSCEPVSGFVATDEWQHYVIEVPSVAEQLAIELTGDGGDLDLYVRKGDFPTLNNYDFRPWLNDSEEDVIVNAGSTVPLSAGSWYVSVNGFIPADYSLSAAIDKCR